MQYKLNTPWNTWLHLINDNNWDINSYKKIFTINNIYDYIFLEQNLNITHYENNMIFIMRNDIFPIWESEDNINGCTYSFKLSKKHIKQWNNILFQCLSENIFIDSNNYHYLNGISIVPKNTFFIVKLWFTSDINLKQLIKPDIPYFNLNSSIKKNNKQ